MYLVIALAILVVDVLATETSFNADLTRETKEEEDADKVKYLATTLVTVAVEVTAITKNLISDLAMLTAELVVAVMYLTTALTILAIDVDVTDCTLPTVSLYVAVEVEEKAKLLIMLFNSVAVLVAAMFIVLVR
jgi:hypothetical protein